MKTSAEISAMMAKLKKEYQTAAQAEFTAGASDLFKAHPRLKSFGWNQYTPYFNDGEECTFRCNNEEPAINGFDYYGDGEEGDGENLLAMKEKTTGWGPSEQPNPNYDPPAKKIVKAVTDFLGSFESSYFKEAFGDHQEVKVTAKGITQDEYAHD